MYQLIVTNYIFYTVKLTIIIIAFKMRLYFFFRKFTYFMALRSDHLETTKYLQLHLLICHAVNQQSVKNCEI